MLNNESNPYPSLFQLLNVEWQGFGSNFWGLDQIEIKTSEINPSFEKLNDDEASDDEDDTGLLPASRGKKYFHKLYVLVIIANLGIFENILHFFI